jgi:hypothetical protein
VCGAAASSWTTRYERSSTLKRGQTFSSAASSTISGRPVGCQKSPARKSLISPARTAFWHPQAEQGEATYAVWITEGDPIDEFGPGEIGFLAIHSGQSGHTVADILAVTASELDLRKPAGTYWRG